MKRRQFNSALAAAGLTSVAAEPLLAAVNPTQASSSNERMARERFEAKLGQRFQAQGVETGQLKLSAVATAAKGRGQQQFHVVFDTDGQAMSEGLYVLKTNGKAEYGLHLVPQETESGQQLIATVNLQTHA